MKRITSAVDSCFEFAVCFCVYVGLLLVGGCANTEIVVPYNAPLMLSGDETFHNPYVRENEQWVKKQGTVTRHQGAVVQLLGATSQPTMQAGAK